ncbi:thiol reductant ABC exporter subunit CydD [Natronosporangium hydrolyticum]|uniref:Thiol reductant ABC exporter subunit CydD n=1 Tax=Natronosporangium hydrolyticum TaxID=2811111 RepID=A0A895YE36_9ACTN|nr:thiol reductant ABC exporter subunit CydD [Natronosporangium hydrolyticum]QSB16047.1 thiol reductant ABC exporter subunit CydD [Natronosporangium hydrolyticum]
MTTRPFDSRLLRQVPAVRGHLVALGLLGTVAAAIIISQAVALATLLAEAVEGRFAAGALAGFVAAIAARAGWLWLSGVVAARTAARVKQELRGELLAAVGRRGPGWVAGQRAGELATLTGRGLDGLDSYFTGYLPQLVLSVTVPVAVLIQLGVADWSSAVIVAVTLPLIPIFGALVGWQTRAATERQWRRLTRLGGHFLDMVAGLATLRAFGRAGAQVETVRRMADRHRSATMRTLRIAFLTALVLELVAAIAVALVAVPIGLRLLAGAMTLQTALLVLFLVPEAFAPLRAAGARFHASLEGLTALDQTFRTLTPAPPVGKPAARRPGPAPGTGASEAGPVIEFDRVSVAYPRGEVLREVSLRIEPGERVALIGPSGAGKSTLLNLLLGFVAPTSGRVLVDGVDLTSIEPADWRRRLAWVPQRPYLFAASVRDNLVLGVPDATPAAVSAAVTAAALDEVVAELPNGLATMLGERGHGLSSGQRQRVAVARAFLRDAPVVLLDEPTARLDSVSESAVCAAAGQLVAGRTALLVAHRPALLSVADRVVRVADGRVEAVTQPADSLASTPAGDGAEVAA